MGITHTKIASDTAVGAAKVYAADFNAEHNLTTSAVTPATADKIIIKDASNADDIAHITVDSLLAMLIFEPTAFATAIDLSTNKVYTQTAVTGALTFTTSGTPKVGAQAILRLISNGVNVPDLTAFKEVTGSSGYSNVANVVNIITFTYDGTDYLYNINQRIGDSGATDLTPPTITSAVVENATPTVINVNFSESLSNVPILLTSSFAVSGKTISSIAYATSTRINITLSAAVANGDVMTLSYTQPVSATNQVRDLAGNLMATVSGVSVTNNVAAGATGLFARFVTPNPAGTTSGTFTETGDYATGYLYSSNTTGSAVLGGLSVTDGSVVAAPLVGDGDFEITLQAYSVSDTPVMLFGTSGTIANQTSAGVVGGLWVNGDNTYWKYEGATGSQVTGAITAAANDRWRIVRVGSTITHEVYRSGSGTALFSFNYTTTSSADLFFIVRRSGTGVVDRIIFARPRINR